MYLELGIFPLDKLVYLVLIWRRNDGSDDSDELMPHVASKRQ